MEDLSHPRGAYGFDAPYVPLILTLVAVAFLGFTVINVIGQAILGAIICALIALGFFFLAGWYVYVTRRGKFVVWARLLESLHLRGDERLLDLGCGRGAVLLQAAKLLPQGQAVGVDLWKTSDQSGNALATTERNAQAEGVADRVHLDTGDMTKLPYDDASFDVVLASISIHNITDREGRAQAVREGARVLRPGGRILIADIRAAKDYAATLTELGWGTVTPRSLGMLMWFGLFNGASVVEACKPAA